MIYTIISTIQKNEIEENRDCRALRQPLPLLPKEIDDFIKNTKHEKLREERYLAYTSLLSSLKAFFSIDNATVAKDREGKPYLVYNTESTHKIHISISHSEDVVAISLSDEGEIGVDIQYKISAERVERLSNRFFSDVEVHSEDMGIKYYYCDILENEAVFEEIILDDADKQEYTAKWAYSESVMKLYGRGFGDVNILTDLIKQCQSEAKKSKDNSWIIVNSAKM